MQVRKDFGTHVHCLTDAAENVKVRDLGKISLKPIKNAILKFTVARRFLENW